MDDLIYTIGDEDMMSDLKNSMMMVIDMINLGKMRSFLGTEVFQRPNGIFICQRKHATKALKCLGMFQSKSKAA